MRRTKIVCTIGPATSSEGAIRRLARAGMDVARLNFSYGSHEAHAEAISRVRAVAKELGRPIGILQDLSGPKLRVGELPGGAVELHAGAEVVLSTARRPSASHLPLPVPELPRAVTAGDRLLLADGRIELRVLKTSRTEVRCQVRVGGVLKSHQGLNVPGVSLPIATVTAKDLADLKFGLEQEVDWVAMSFVREANDLAPLRRAIGRADRGRPSTVARGDPERSRTGRPPTAGQTPFGLPVRAPGVMAKIEKHEAVDRLDEIIAAADGIMVARGDLGVELPLARVPLLQKDIIARCNRAAKPVVTATQMLETMVENPRPTRAEVSDVANAVFDGTDAVMLSGETAVGRFPQEAVRVMADVVSRAEAGLDFAARSDRASAWSCQTTADGISQAACALASDIGARAIITATGSGYTALMVSRQRPAAPVVAVTPDVATLRRLTLVWGLHPLLAPRGRNTDELIVSTISAARKAGYVRAGDRVVVTAGVPPGPGNTNLIKVEVVGRHHRL